MAKPLLELSYIFYNGPMLVPVLATKLYIPHPPPKAVLRRRLLERLNAGLHRKLTLIAAPAGCGKTTLLSAWIAGLQLSKRPVAWLSLDVGDSDPVRLLAYLVAALQTIEPTIGEGALGLLQSSGSSQSPLIEAVLTSLLNEIAGLPHNFVLVLDDYHVIDAPAVDQGIAFLLDHMPPHMHLVITSREDPSLPLARLRARDQLTELRAVDLRFTPLEASEFLQAMGLSLSAKDVAALEARTEGWIAGLQLAALSLQGNPDVSGFIQAFAGDHRYIADYLVEEVLQRQPESVRSFLLQTSILDRLNGPLCDAVTGQQDSYARLAALERGNFFVVPLDDKRNWYRYHHLFADVLYAHLMAEQPEQVATLHLRASEWYERNGSADDAVAQAIRHALAAHDFERVADLIERAVPEIRKSRQDDVVLGWLKTLPNDVVRRRPVISGWYAHALLGIGALDDADARLRDAERWLESVDTSNSLGVRSRSEAPGPEDGMIVVDEEEFRRLPGTIAIARSGLALVLGNVADSVKYARRVLDLVPEEDYLPRGSASALLGLAAWASGDLDAAYRLYGDGMTYLQKGGLLSYAIGGALALADIRIEQGRLREARSTYERGLQLATEETKRGAPSLPEASDIYAGMSEMEIEHNDLDAAMQHLLVGKELGEHNLLSQNRYCWCVAMSGLRGAQGDLDGALDLLREAESLHANDFFPNVRPVAALKTRIWIVQGRLAEAIEWVRKQGLSVEDAPSYLREFEHLTLVRVLLAQYKNDHASSSLNEALGLLERLLQAAGEGGRVASMLEVLVLQALIHHEQGDTLAALAPLQRALTLAKPEGYVRLFVGEGVPMSELLREVVKQDNTSNYARQLLAANGEVRESAEVEDAKSRTHVTHALVESLSERELEVLRLLRTELSGPEVAHELMVSLSTIRTHTRNIYAKLGVDNRRAAVRRGEELHLL